MAIINCAECNGKVSTKASSCPHCGNPKKFFEKKNKLDTGNFKKSKKILTKKKRSKLLFVLPVSLVLGSIVAIKFLGFDFFKEYHETADLNISETHKEVPISNPEKRIPKQTKTNFPGIGPNESKADYASRMQKIYPG